MEKSSTSHSYIGVCETMMRRVHVTSRKCLDPVNDFQPHRIKVHTSSVGLDAKLGQLVSSPGASVEIGYDSGEVAIRQTASAICPMYRIPGRSRGCIRYSKAMDAAGSLGPPNNGLRCHH